MSDNQIHENEDGYPSRPVSVVPYSPAEQMPSNNEQPPYTGPCDACRKAGILLNILNTAVVELSQTWSNFVHKNPRAEECRWSAVNLVSAAAKKVQYIKKLECFCSPQLRTTRMDNSAELPGQDNEPPGIQHMLVNPGQQGFGQHSQQHASQFADGSGHPQSHVGQQSSGGIGGPFYRGHMVPGSRGPYHDSRGHNSQQLPLNPSGFLQQPHAAGNQSRQPLGQPGQNPQSQQQYYRHPNYTQ